MKELGQAAAIIGGMVGLYFTVQQFRALERARTAGDPEQLRIMRAIDRKLERLLEGREAR